MWLRPTRLPPFLASEHRRVSRALLSPNGARGHGGSASRDGNGGAGKPWLTREHNRQAKSRPRLWPGTG
ncbi:hypothetical protein GN956_G19238 [Arapaima gigas]